MASGGPAPVILREVYDPTNPPASAFKTQVPHVAQPLRRHAVTQELLIRNPANNAGAGISLRT